MVVCVLDGGTVLTSSDSAEPLLPTAVEPLAVVTTEEIIGVDICVSDSDFMLDSRYLVVLPLSLVELPLAGIAEDMWEMELDIRVVSEPELMVDELAAPIEVECRVWDDENMLAARDPVVTVKLPNSVEVIGGVWDREIVLVPGELSAMIELLASVEVCICVWDAGIVLVPSVSVVYIVLSFSIVVVPLITVTKEETVSLGVGTLIVV
jgi:hypothetical protein